MKTAIITTTINIPYLLKDYTDNAKKFNHKDIFFVITGDKKSHPDTRDFCDNLAKESGYEITFLNVSDQEKFLEPYTELKDFLPYNCIQRRNVSFLYAYEKKAEIIITIDDDNFITENSDFIGEHSIVGTNKEIEALSSSSGWINVCDFLEEKNNHPFYHRGFPLEKRWIDQTIDIKNKKGRIVVNAGFWLQDPDIDAITRLTLPIKSTGFKKKNNFVIDIGTWTPFNSQNTSVLREVIQSYFMSPFIGRYDDIWPSYLVKKIADHLGDFISFGFPLVKQDRNEQDIIVNLENEIWGMRLTNRFCNILKEIKLSENDYLSCSKEIYKKLKQYQEQKNIFNEKENKFFNKFLEGINVWNKTIDRANKKYIT